MDKVEIDKKIKNIENDLELLENGRIYELTKGAGIPKCSTLANRMKDDLRAIVNGFGLLLEEETISIDREQFDMLTGQLKGISDEVAILSKKQLDVLVNTFKVGLINGVLSPLKEIMREEPSAEFLDLLVEPDPEGKSDKSRNTYSDTALIFSQYLAACERYRKKYYAIDDYLNVL